MRGGSHREIHGSSCSLRVLLKLAGSKKDVVLVNVYSVGWDCTAVVLS